MGVGDLVKGHPIQLDRLQVVALFEVDIAHVHLQTTYNMCLVTQSGSSLAVGVYNDCSVGERTLYYSFSVIILLACCMTM